MEIRKFAPGELICRQTKRSNLNSLFKDLVETKSTSLQKDLDNMVQDQITANIINEADPVSGNTAVSGFVSKLTVKGPDFSAKKVMKQ